MKPTRKRLIQELGLDVRMTKAICDMLRAEYGIVDDRSDDSEPWSFLATAFLGDEDLTPEIYVDRIFGPMCCQAGTLFDPQMRHPTTREVFKRRLIETVRENADIIALLNLDLAHWRSIGTQINVEFEEL